MDRHSSGYRKWTESGPLLIILLFATKIQILLEISWSLWYDNYYILGIWIVFSINCLQKGSREGKLIFFPSINDWVIRKTLAGFSTIAGVMSLREAVKSYFFSGSTIRAFSEYLFRASKKVIFAKWSGPPSKKSDH